MGRRWARRERLMGSVPNTNLRLTVIDAFNDGSIQTSDREAQIALAFQNATEEERRAAAEFMKDKCPEGFFSSVCSLVGHYFAELPEVEKMKWRNYFSGGINPSVIGDIITNHRLPMDYAYTKYLERGGTMGGKVVAHFDILPDGSVQAVNLIPEGSIRDDLLLSDLRHVIADIRFPAPINGGKVSVNYPFV